MQSNNLYGTLLEQCYQPIKKCDCNPSGVGVGRDEPQTHYSMNDIYLGTRSNDQLETFVAYPLIQIGIGQLALPVGFQVSLFPSSRERRGFHRSRPTCALRSRHQPLNFRPSARLLCGPCVNMRDFVVNFLTSSSFAPLM